MNAFAFQLLRISWQAALLVLIVLVVQRAFGRRLGARWRYAFWFLVMARLALPWLPASSVSVFNFVRPESLIVRPAVEQSNKAPSLSVASHSAPGTTLIRKPASPTAPGRISVTSLLWTDGAGFIFFLAWAVGALILTARTINENLSFRRRLDRDMVKITDPAVLAAFGSCKAEMGVTGQVRLYETALVNSPALYGIGRPILLLPAGVSRRFDARELRHIFLHELAHVRRRDMIVLWLVAFWKILHWFNPVLRFGFRRMAEDRELACDELALSRAGEQEGGPYGETILKLLESCAYSGAAPGLIGILEHEGQIKRRIARIAGPRLRARYSVPAALVMLVVGLVTLTDGQPAKAVRASRLGDLYGQKQSALLADMAAIPRVLEPGLRIVQLLASADSHSAAWQRELNNGFMDLEAVLSAAGSPGGARTLVEDLRNMVNYLYGLSPDNAGHANLDDLWDD